MATRPGLILVYSQIKPSSNPLSESAYHSWYDAHLRDILAIQHAHAPRTAARYKIQSTTATTARGMEYIATYPTADVDFVESEEWKARPMEGAFAEIAFDARVYEEVQVFVPGTGERRGGRRGKGLVVVGITPGGGEEGDRDFEAWYRGQHLDMLSMCRGYIRTTRYKLHEKHTAGFAIPERDDEDLPKYLAFHEYDTLDLPTDQIKQTTSTEWSRRVIAQAVKFERTVAELIREEGDLADALPSLRT